MENKINTLNDLPLNKYGYIKCLKCNDNIKRRLLDLGLIEGTLICPVLVSASKDPRAFLVRGSTIAIRNEDANKIEINFHQNEKNS